MNSKTMDAQTASEIEMSAPRPVDSLSRTLDLPAKLHQRTIVDYLSGIEWRRGSAAPIVVELDPTSRCNLACPDCISGALLNKAEISSERLIRLTHELIDAGVKAVILIGGGEPMMHPAIGEVIRLLGENQVKIGITTNGLFLRKHLELTAAYASWVRVSMDAGTSRTFAGIRPSPTGKSLFDAAVRNMESFARVKTGRLGYSFMVYHRGNHGFQGIPIRRANPDTEPPIQTNVHEIHQAALLARSIGCDYFEVKPMYDANHFAIIQPDHIARVADAQIALAHRLDDARFRVIEATKLGASLHGDSRTEPKPYHRCAATQMRTLITPSGVYPCPYFRGDEQRSLGMIQEMDFNALWTGQTRRAALERLDPSRDCRMHCIRHESNLTIESWIQGGWPLPVDDFDLFV